MRLDTKAFAIAGGLLWGGAILVTGLVQLVSPGYGAGFLELASSVYPGYEPGGFGSVIVGTLYGLVDGFVGGFLLAWLYNRLAGGRAAA